MTYLRLIELKMAAAGRTGSIEKVMNDIRHLHYVLSKKKGDGHPNAAWKLSVRPRAKSYRPLATTLTGVGSHEALSAEPFLCADCGRLRRLSPKLL